MRFCISNQELNLDEAQGQQKGEEAQNIEGYHRGLKPEGRIEGGQAGKARRQPNHIMLALPAVVGLEWKGFSGSISRWPLKPDIIRPAVGVYLPEPHYILDHPTPLAL